MMRIRLTGKAKWIFVLSLFIIAFSVGILLENMRNDAFSVETLTAVETTAPMASQLPQSDMVIDGKININTADKDTLMMIDGVGESTASKIIEYRTENGPFEAIEEIMNVNGIGEKKFENMRDMICVG